MGVLNLTSAQSIPMTDTPVSPLRRRMIEDMTIRKFAPPDAGRLHPRRQELQRFPWRVAGHGELRGRAPLSAASGFERHGVPTINHSLTALLATLLVT
jgi:integrase/recombinase XerD